MIICSDVLTSCIYSQSYRWLSNHKWFVMILFYLLLLLLIGIWRSRYMSQLYYQYSKRYLSI